MADDQQVDKVEQEYEEEPGFVSHVWLNRRICFVIAVIPLILAGLLRFFEGHSTWVGLPAVLLGVMIYLPLNSIRKHALKRRITKKQMKVGVNPEGQWVSNKMVNRFRHVLADSEDSIELITRFHPVKILAALGRYNGDGGRAFFKGIFRFLFRLAVILLVLVGFFYGGLTGFLPWWTPWAVTIFVGVSIWLATTAWRRTVFILTNENARIVFRPPLWLAPLLRGRQPVVPLIHVDFWDKEDSRIANYTGLDYGVLMVDSPSDKDKVFNYLPFMPRHEWVMVLLSSLIGQARNRNLRVAAVVN